MKTRVNLVMRMRRNSGFVSSVLTLWAGCVLGSAQTSIVDGVGRTVKLPAQVNRVYSTSPVATIMLYSLAPEKMVGWNYPLLPTDARFVLPSVRELPALGGWFGQNGTGNRETLLAARPDVVLSFGTVDATAADFSDRLERQTGIPALTASGRLVDLADTYELMGKVCGSAERAHELAEYCRAVLRDCAELLKDIPESERVRVYYAEGPSGLQTDGKGSLHAETLDFVGGENVATGNDPSHYGRAQVSMEQLLKWQPQAMIICPENKEGWRPDWLSDPLWQQVPAVKNGRVYVIPSSPFNWFDRPPSVNRLIGLRWTAWVLYPKRVKFDMLKETQDFYRKFYHYDLGETEAKQLLNASKWEGPHATNR